MSLICFVLLYENTCICLVGGRVSPASILPGAPHLHHGGEIEETAVYKRIEHLGDPHLITTCSHRHSSLLWVVLPPIKASSTSILRCQGPRFQSMDVTIATPQQASNFNSKIKWIKASDATTKKWIGFHKTELYKWIKY